MKGENLLRKLAFIAIVASALVYLPFSVPHASAGALEDVQALMQMKKDFEQGNKSAAVAALTQAILAKTGKQDIAQIIATGDINQAAQNYAKQLAAEELNRRLLPYQNQINLLQTLLNINNQLKPETAKANDALLGAPKNYKRVIDITATAYAPGPLDNGKWGNLTYMGGTVHKGVAAVDPNVIPMGSKLWVEGYGYAVAEDQGSAIKGNRIDLAFDTRQEALDYGIKKVKVYILE